MVRSGNRRGTADPRIERSRRVIRQAALDELAEVGYGGFTIESVAHRAGAGKSTVYRLWGTKLELIMDALEALNVQPEPERPDGSPGERPDGSPRQRVEALLRHLAEVLVDSTFSACVPALVDAAARDPAVAEAHHRYSALRRAALTEAVADGVASGEFRDDLDPELASQALAGALFYRRLFTGEPFDPARVSELVDAVTGGGDRR